MKYKLSKLGNMKDNFILGKIYKIFPYNNNYDEIFDDFGFKHIVNTHGNKFNESFINLNKERKDKLTQIECI
jgi:hypothetical protein